MNSGKIVFYFGKTKAVFFFMHLVTSIHLIMIEKPVIDLNKKPVLDMYNFPWKSPLFLYAHEKYVSASDSVLIVGEPDLFMGWFMVTAGELDELLGSFFFVVSLDVGDGEEEGVADEEEADDEDLVSMV